MDWWITVLILGQLAFAGWMAQIVAIARQNNARLRSEERLRILERFSNGQELAEFLNTPAGDRLLRLLSVRPAHPVRTLTRTAGAGIVLLFAGIGLLVASYAAQEKDFLIPGYLFLLAGAGVFLAAGMSAILYRRSGLMSTGTETAGAFEV